MKTNTGLHTTNYNNTLIEVAEDTKASHGTPPPEKNDKVTIANMQYEIIKNHPYHFTSDDIIFQIYADRNDLTKPEYPHAREQFFSKGQACLRTSPLAKNYGFGIHCDGNGRVALVAMETEKYQTFLDDPKIQKVKAMRSARK